MIDPDHWLPRARQGMWRPGMIDLGPGYPDASLLPGAWLRAALQQVTTTCPLSALGYGTSRGPEPLRQFVADRFGAQTSEVMTTAGTSAALSAIATMLQRSGTSVLVESTTYDLAVRVFENRGVHIDTLPPSPMGVDPDDVAQSAMEIHRRDGQFPAIYLIPTFHNPTGRVLSAEVRTGLVDLLSRIPLQLIEDQAYVDLDYEDQPPPPPLWTMAGDRTRHVALYTFAKVVAPGLRLGALVTDPSRCTTLAKDGERLSGGGPSHLIATALAAAAENGDLDVHMQHVRTQLRHRRDLVCGLLADGLPPTVTARPCLGGFFLWLDLPADLEDLTVQRAARAIGIDVAPGHRYGDPHGIRLSLAPHTAVDLSRAIPRLCEVLSELTD